jgi:hypothetical protein
MVRVWDEKQGKMVSLTPKKGEKSVVRIAVDSTLADILKGFAKSDGYDFAGISYVTVKENGKTKHDKDGKPVFVMVKGTDGKMHPKTENVAESIAKVHSAISDYVTVAVKKLIAERETKTATTPKQ